MSRTKLDHIAIAVNDLEESLAFYRDQFGLKLLEVEVVEEQGVVVAKLDLGNTHLELLEPMKPDTPVGKFIQQRGPGLHHICVAVNSIKDELANLKNHGAKLINEEPKIGAGGAQIAFIHPKTTCGVLMELSQPKKGRRSVEHPPTKHDK
ncbi:MAG TPA: methylmalonyl-CoA epimerase [Oculatellaceae cyanobacterium]